MMKTKRVTSCFEYRLLPAINLQIKGYFNGKEAKFRSEKKKILSFYKLNNHVISLLDIDIKSSNEFLEVYPFVVVNDKWTIPSNLSLSTLELFYGIELNEKEVYKLDFISNRNDSRCLLLLGNSIGLFVLSLIAEEANNKFKIKSQDRFFDPFKSFFNLVIRSKEAVATYFATIWDFFLKNDQEEFLKLLEKYKPETKISSENPFKLLNQESFNQAIENNQRLSCFLSESYYLVFKKLKGKIDNGVELKTDNKSFLLTFYFFSDSLDLEDDNFYQFLKSPFIHTSLKKNFQRKFHAQKENKVPKTAVGFMLPQWVSSDLCELCFYDPCWTYYLKEDKYTAFNFVKSGSEDFISFKLKPFSLFIDNLSSFDILENTIKVNEVKDKKLLSLFKLCHDKPFHFKKIYHVSLEGKFTLDIDHLKKTDKSYKLKKAIDHRVQAIERKLYFFHRDAGLGFPIWLPNGTAIKNSLKLFLRKKYDKYGFQFVNSPILGSGDLYKESGHLSRYYECMFSELDLKDHASNPNQKIKQNTNSLKSSSIDEFYLRPMTCPHHCLIFKELKPTYKDLPLKIAEESPIFRHEYSGALSGLERVRGMELYDAHIFCVSQESSIKAIVDDLLKLTKEILDKFKINFWYSLSLGDKSNKSKIWKNAENILRECLEKSEVHYFENHGEAAFYGPKIDLQINTLWDYEITLSTIQLDYLLPRKENLNLEYIAKENNKVHPVLIHFGVIGTFERFISVLLEQTGGVLPTFISPIQVQIIPIFNKENKVYQKILDFCNVLFSKLLINDFRVKLDNREERLNYKIRYGQTNKIPYQIVIGENEVKNFKDDELSLNEAIISVRKYGSKTSEKIKFSQFLSNLIKERDDFLK